MKKYELLLVLPGTLDEKEAETRSNEILSIVKEHGTDAEIVSMGKMRLAYPIKQIRYGYFYTLIFSTETNGLKSLQEKLGLMRDLLRAIISVYNPNYTPASKLSYSTNAAGVNVVSEEIPEVEKNEKPVDKVADAKVSIQDIDKKLDEILSGDIIAGV
jgi:ribosomal protein S6